MSDLNKKMDVVRAVMRQDYDIAFATGDTDDVFFMRVRERRILGELSLEDSMNRVESFANRRDLGAREQVRFANAVTKAINEEIIVQEPTEGDTTS